MLKRPQVQLDHALHPALFGMQLFPGISRRLEALPRLASHFDGIHVGPDAELSYRLARK